MATPPIPRPIPAGVSPRGIPLWDGADNRRFREAHGVGQGIVARALAQTTTAVGVTFENVRTRVAIPYDRVERYLQAVERMAAMRDATATTALAELNERVAARSQSVLDGGIGQSRARR
jgi:hypothetical protein